MIKRKIKIAAGVLTGAATAAFTTAIWLGKEKNVGPFAVLHSWDSYRKGWRPDVDAIKAKYSTDFKGEIIFYGASNFACWTEMEEDILDYPVQNHAFGGSTDHDLMKYAEEILYPYQPEIVFFQTGSNDYTMIEGSDEEKIRQCMEYKQEMFETFHAHLPEAKFVVMSGLLLPGRKQYLNLTLKINEELKVYCGTKDYMEFVDANAMTWDGTNFDKSLFVKDMIHLNRKGQKRWCEEYIKPVIRRMMDVRSAV